MRLVESNEPIVKSGRTGMVVCGDSELHPSAGRRLGFARTTAPQPAAGQTLRPRGNPLIGFPLAKTSHWELFAPLPDPRGDFVKASDSTPEKAAGAARTRQKDMAPSALWTLENPILDCRLL